MRYFEIAKPPARHILADAEPKEAAGEPRSSKIETAGERGMKSAGSLKSRTAILPEPSNLTSRQSRRRHL
jgi:hypothetical protein